MRVRSAQAWCPAPPLASPSLSPVENSKEQGEACCLKTSAWIQEGSETHSSFGVWRMLLESQQWACVVLASLVTCPTLW